MELDFDFKAFLRRHPDLCWKTNAILIRCDTPDRNGHVYPRELMVRELARNGQVIGYLPHDGSMYRTLESAAFVVERAAVVHDSVQIQVKFFENEAGWRLKRFMDCGGHVDFSMEGVGTVDGGVVQNDYHLTGIIATPGPPKP